MDIQIDSREKARAIKLILKEFDKQNVNSFVSKLLVGDYMNLDNPRLIVDRKQDIQELVGNINTTKEHERFRKELLRANKAGIKLVFLIEHGEDIKSIEDVYFFYQPQIERFRWITKKDAQGNVLKGINGKPIKERIPYMQNAIDGKKIYKSLCTIRDRYNADFVFCTKEETGRKILEILRGDG